MGKFSIFQCGKYHLDLAGSTIMIFSQSFFVVIEYIVCFAMLLEECRGGIGKEFINHIG